MAKCESGFNPDAVSPNGRYVGLFQHARKHWDARYDRNIGDHPRRSTWGIPRTPFDARGNLFVTLLMVRRSGWGAWSCD